MPVTLGLDSLGASGRLSNQRVGLVSNPASLDRHFQHAAKVVVNSGARLTALFGPQHGFTSDRQDNMVETPHEHDEHHLAPVYSLYSETRTPTTEMLNGIDLMVIDLPDIGTRVYTYASTMANCLRACREHGIPAIVTDRPNPIDGVTVEGPMLESGWTSFVGQFPIPLRHGLTMGELAELFNSEFGVGAELEIVPMTDWNRAMYFDDTGLPWVMPSPNLPTLESLIVYPGMVLLEGTNLSEGRGTTRPFELFGAPWLHGEQLAIHLNDLGLPGVRFRPTRFEPTFQKHAGTACAGCQIHVVDRQRYCSVKTTLAILDACRKMAPDQFAWKEPPYEYEYERMPIDLLWGSDRLRTYLDTSRSVADAHAEGLDDFLEIRERYLLY